MTALVAVMNKQAVALAADSAGTVQIPGKEQHKIYAMNKVFALSKSKPVGMMICGQSQFLGLPWESIVKQFRRAERDRAFATVHEWRDNFLQYLDSLISEADDVTRDQQYLIRYAFILDDTIQPLLRPGKTADELAEEFEHSLVTRAENLSRSNQVVAVDDEAFAAFISRNQEALEQAENKVFADRELAPLELSEARLPLLKALLERSPPNGQGTSEIVFAGFGDADWFPSVTSVHVDGTSCNQVRQWEGTNVKVTRESGSEVAAFAQADIVWTLLRGIHPVLSSELERALHQALTQHVPGMIAQVLDEHFADKDVLQHVVQQIIEIGAKSFSAIHEQATNYCLERHILPVLASIQHLGKGELAQLAESLITTTSLKYRMAIDAQESVGGPVDVAVISKDEGFIWIQRKHYFELQQNPAFSRLESEL